MLKLFIVDDEFSVREGLANYIDWSPYNIEIIGLAENGLIAFESIKEVQPDLIITDIKMPHMDGIELANKIRKHYPNIEIVFLSGYGDMEYLKGAIHVEALDFLLKPFDPSELDMVIRNATNRIYKKQQQAASLEELKQKLEKSLPLLKEQKMMSLLLDNEQSKNIAHQLYFLGIQFPVNGRYCVMIVSVDNERAVYSQLLEKEQYLQDLILHDAIKEIIPEVDGYAVNVRSGMIAVLLRLDNMNDDFVSCLASTLREKIPQTFSHDFTIGIGCEVESLDNLHQSYRTAQQAVDNKLFLGKNKVIAFDSLQLTERENLPHFSIHHRIKYTNLLQAGNKENLDKYINELFYQLKKNILCKREIHTIVTQVFLETAHYLLQLKEDNSTEILSSLEKIQNLEIIEDMSDCIKQLVYEICDITNRSRAEVPTRIISKVQDYIEKNYSSPVKISSIAEHVYLSPPYLCLIYKQETGQTINEYLTKVRMDHAICFLNDPNIKAYQISEMVGYNDPSYFSKLFKKHTGLTLSEYREVITSSR